MDYLEHQTLPEDSAVAKQVLGQAQKGYYILDGVLYFEDSVHGTWTEKDCSTNSVKEEVAVRKSWGCFCRPFCSKEADAASQSVILLATDES